ncbi:hypothetical protein F5144DRAFT_559540, partial [Chaetomium tenue]
MAACRVPMGGCAESAPSQSLRMGPRPIRRGTGGTATVPKVPIKEREERPPFLTFPKKEVRRYLGPR